MAPRASVTLAILAIASLANGDPASRHPEGPGRFIGPKDLVAGQDEILRDRQTDGTIAQDDGPRDFSLSGDHDARSAPALKDVLRGSFLVGAALNRDQIEGRDGAALEIVARQFTTISPEDVLKWENVHPEADRYDFDPADAYVALGGKLGVVVVGHTLVWHQQTPRWVFQDAKGAPIGREALLARLGEHIRTVVGRYRGRIRGWDVVNEALEDDGTLRKTPWLETLGEEYVARAFEMAREADPSAELYYNDYNLWKPAKREAAIRLVQSLRARGIRVDGVGEQGHWLLGDPPMASVEETIEAFARIGVKVLITELDVDPLPRPGGLVGADVSKQVELKKTLDPYAGGLPDAIQESLAQRYADAFAVFMRHRDAVARVTFWGVTDRSSWLNDWPVRGRTNHPLLWDRQGRPKPAFDAVVEALAKAR
jgi:endo-1,4-beta-xylanase